MISGATPVANSSPDPRTAARRLPYWLIGAVLLFPFFAYWQTAASIVAIWDSSGTYAHGYVILPISLWLIWDRRADLVGVPVQPCWPALALLAGCGLAWLLGEMGEVQVVRHYAFVALLPLSALAILGYPMARRMAFPLAFLLFAVPFGDIFIDPLIQHTANFTVDALVATGIPVFREGNNFSIPSGNWSVVEACSGVRYLISSVTLGSLYAYLTYRSAWRRGLFVLMSIIVPIFANGARAYMIVMIGHLSGMTLAVGVDHLIYGWLFFGLVMFLLFWIGTLWREDRDPQAAPKEKVVLAAPRHAPLQVMCLAALATVFVVGIWPAYDYYLEKSAAKPLPVVLAPLALPAAPAPAFADWKPAYAPPTAQLQQYFTQDGHALGLTLLYYRAPPEGIKLVTSTNRLAPAIAPQWLTTGSGVRDEQIGARVLQVRESRLMRGAQRIVVWHWYWIDGATTRSDYTGKLLQIRQKLLHGRDDGAAVMVSAAYDENPDTARAPLRAFLAAELARIEAGLASNLR